MYDVRTKRMRFATLASGGFLLALVVAWRLGVLPGLVLALCVAMSAVAFVAVASDKRRARAGRRRVPEATLHALELLGGWPGSLLAQRRLAHKTRKVGYQMAFWAIALLHVAALVFVWTQPVR
jgi:uncharacterized membrane protein YsdA (DUF1294 family)